MGKEEFIAHLYMMGFMMKERRGFMMKENKGMDVEPKYFRYPSFEKFTARAAYRSDRACSKHPSWIVCELRGKVIRVNADIIAESRTYDTYEEALEVLKRFRYD